MIDLKKFTHDKNNKSVVGETQWSLLHFQFPSNDELSRYS
nr:MAG TPA: hypothetical protein [Caudoviricetes sp.]